MSNPLKLVIQNRDFIGRHYASDPRKRVTFSVYIDCSDLDRLALKVSRNQRRKGKLGPLRIEVHSVQSMDAAHV